MLYTSFGITTQANMAEADAESDYEELVNLLAYLHRWIDQDRGSPREQQFPGVIDSFLLCMHALVILVTCSAKCNEAALISAENRKSR